MEAPPANAWVPAQAGTHCRAASRIGPGCFGVGAHPTSGGALDGWVPRLRRNLNRRLDRVELPGDVVGDAPQPADVALSDQRVGVAAMAPVEQVDVLPVLEGR